MQPVLLWLDLLVGLNDSGEGARISRNAIEILERLDVLDPAKRWEHAAYLRDVPCVDAPELLHLGYEVKDLLKAGYEEMELRDQEGVTEDELVRAAEAIKRESQPKKPTRRKGSNVKLEVMQSAATQAFKDVLRRSASKVSPSEVAPAGR